jgi:hypothetical protein
MSVQIQLRRDTAADWTSADPTLAEGEIGIETDSGRFKIGDGSTEWSSLPYVATQTQLQGVVMLSDTASQADADPGPGAFRWNHATQSSATELYVNDATATSVDITAVLDSMGVDGWLYLQQLDDETKWQVWQVNALVASSDYYALEVVLLAYGGALGDVKPVMCLFVPGTPMAFPDTSGTVGYLNIPQNSQSGAYTAVLADAGKHLLHPSADTTARTFTIPANASVAFPIGTVITFVNQDNAGTLTIAITSDTMRLAGAGTTGSRTLAENGIATALKLTSTEWIISGTGLT